MIRRMAMFAVALIVMGQALPAAAQGPPPPRVEVVQAELRELPATLTLVATLQPFRRSLVAAEVAGLTVKLPVRQGDAITAGQLLRKLDDEVVSMRLAEAKARLRSLETRWQELRNGLRSEELTRLKALHEESVATLERWTFEMERIQKLYGDQDAGNKEVYETRALVRGAEQQAQAAKAMYDMGIKGPRAEEVERASCDVAEQQAVVARLERELAKTEIRAPFGGVVVRLASEVGQWVDQGGPVLEMIDISAMLVRVHVPESAVNYAACGTPAQVYLDALKRTYEGKIVHVIPQADEAARTFPVEVEIPNADGLLKAGMFARATVPSGPTQQTLTVPKDAIVQRQGVNYVTVIQDGPQGTLGVPTAVELGASADTWIAVAGGNLTEQTKVVVRGNEGIYVPTPVAIAE